MTERTPERPPPVHPGEILADEMATRNLTPSGLSLKLRVPHNRVGEIIKGQRTISADTALRLGRYFGTGGAFWFNLQAQYDLALAERVVGKQIARDVDPADADPIAPPKTRRKKRPNA